MPKGITLGIAADTRDAAKGIKSGIIDPLEDASDALDDLAKSGAAAGVDLESTFRDQQRSTERLSDDITDLNVKIRDSGRSAYRPMADEADRASHRTQEGFDEIKDSARSNAIEVGASFTGGFDQALGGLQGFVAEFAAGFGPAGVLAGVGAAAVLGTITQSITDGQEAAEAQKAAISSLASEYIETGKVGKRSFDAVTGALTSMATSDGDDVIITLQKAWAAARIAGADYSDIVKAIASGNETEIGRARRAVEQLDGAHRSAANTALSGARAAVQANGREAGAVDELRGALAKAENQAEQAGRAQELAAEAGLSKLQLKKSLIEQLETAYDDAAGSADDFINKEGEFDPSGFIKKVQKVRAELARYKDDLAESDLSAEAKKFLESQGAETAAAMLRGYQKASPKQRAQLAEIWSTAGDDNATTYDAALGKGLAKIKPKVDIPKPIVPAPDSSALDRYLQNPQRVRLMLEVYDRKGQRVY